MSAERVTPEQLPTLGDFPVTRPVQTRWADDDVYGHVNNVVYYAMFDTAVNGWLMEATGADIRQLPAIGLVVETSCRFLRQLSFPEPVEVGIALERQGRSSVVYRLGIFGTKDPSAPRAVGRFVHVYVDAETRRPVDIPAEIKQALATLG